MVNQNQTNQKMIKNLSRKRVKEKTQEMQIDAVINVHVQVHRSYIRIQKQKLYYICQEPVRKK